MCIDFSYNNKVSVVCTILKPENIGHRNINFNEILISLQWFLIAEL